MSTLGTPDARPLRSKRTGLGLEFTTPILLLLILFMLGRAATGSAGRGRAAASWGMRTTRVPRSSLEQHPDFGIGQPQLPVDVAARFGKPLLGGVQRGRPELDGAVEVVGRNGVAYRAAAIEPISQAQAKAS